MIVHDTVAGVKWARRHPGNRLGGPIAALWVAGKWIIPLLLGSVFVGLFALANPVVERWVSHGLQRIYDWVILLPDLLRRCESCSGPSR